MHKLMAGITQRFPRFPAFIKLIRADKPIGTLLLLWPTLGALWLASDSMPSGYLLLIFIAGTWLMRSGGCAINDYADIGIDGSVLRTKERPLITGTIKRKEALMVFVVFCLLSFCLLLFTNKLTIELSFGAAFVAALYPFMKRYTHMPQVVLGIAFSWGILMAFTATTGEWPPAAAWLLFVANCLWTVAYDTEYAMVDREYDLKLGVKSTAILFGDADKVIIGTLQAMFVLAMAMAGLRFELGWAYFLGLAVAAALLVYQQTLLKDRDVDKCFSAFLNNHWVGLSIFAGIVLDALVS
ncbi:MAG: 4-hydroxybenzoate octaprenyltransferase [Pseudohongiellaceae bacterium]|nr:4-hydroxybenzoate octaprenyltransferase [Pseudohongiellaceae bacterium]